MKVDVLVPRQQSDVGCCCIHLAKAAKVPRQTWPAFRSDFFRKQICIRSTYRAVWPYESVKKSPKMLPNTFLPKWIHNLHRGTKKHKNVVFLCNLKNYPRLVNNRTLGEFGPKIRPICSPCNRVSFIASNIGIYKQYSNVSPFIYCQMLFSKNCNSTFGFKYYIFVICFLWIHTYVCIHRYVKSQ
jgi:hypothetical protein